jgi:hypothetical protein
LFQQYLETQELAETEEIIEIRKPPQKISLIKTPFAADAYSASGTVEPSRNAALLPLMVATQSGVPVGRSKDMWDELMCTVKPILQVRYRTDGRLFLRSGTCKTLVNSTALTLFPLMTGLNTTVPTPAEYTTSGKLVLALFGSEWL